MFFFFFFQAEDGIRDADVTGVQTCALPISCVRNSAISGLERVICQGIPLASWVDDAPAGVRPGGRPATLWQRRLGTSGSAAPHVGEGVRFAMDSPLEGDGFEPSVPRGDNIFETAPLEASKPALGERRA